MGAARNAPTNLRAARLRRRWTEDDVAVRLHQLAIELGEQPPGADANTVSKWERGARNVGRHYRPRLCLVFEAAPEQLGFAPTPRLLQDVADLARCRPEGVRQPGSDHVDEHLDQARLDATVRHLWPIDRPLLDDLEAGAWEFARRAEAEPPRSVLPAMQRLLGVLEELLTRSHPAALEARLHAVASRVAELVGFSSYIAALRVDAFNAYAVAEAMAREAGSGELLAMAMAARSRLYSRGTQGTGSPERAIALLSAAELAAGPTSPAGLRAWTHGRRAEEHAELGDDLASGRDLERAYRIAEASPGDVNLFSPRSSAWLVGYAGARALKLGRGAEAIRIYNDVLARTDPGLLWERSLALTHLAAAWSLEDDPDRACDLLVQAVDLCVAGGGQSGIRHALRAREQLPGAWRGSPALRRLDEALRAVHRG